MYIMQRQETQPKHLVAGEEVADVGPREPRARRALAAVVERARVRSQLGAPDVELPIAGERGTLAAVARRGDAVEEIDAPRDALDEVLWEADAHEVAGFVLRQLVVNDLEHLVHLRLGLADGQSTDRVAGEISHASNGSRRIAAQVRMDAALQDRKEGLGIPHSSLLIALERRYTPSQPPLPSLARFTRERNLSLPGHHVVVLHDDVGAGCTLEGDDALRREESAGSIDVASEF